jgi:hypothetical protein
VPFDGIDFLTRRKQPARPSGSENLLTVLLLLLGLTLLVLPVSAAGLVDLVTYIRSR